MTSLTDTEFGTYSLRTAGILGAEETATSADLEWVMSQNEAEIMTLSSINLPIWNGSNLSVPVEFRNPLARRCALAWLPSFGLIDLASATMAMREAERYLTLLSATRLKPLELRTNDAKRILPPGFNFTQGI